MPGNEKFQKFQEATLALPVIPFHSGRNRGDNFIFPTSLNLT